MVYVIGMGTVIDLHGSNPGQAATVWAAIDIVHLGLGGEIEIVGGLWILLVSWAALRSDGLPRVLNYLGVLIGVAGILTLVPALRVLAYAFGLGQILWFIWLGIVMLRGENTAS